MHDFPWFYLANLAVITVAESLASSSNSERDSDANAKSLRLPPVAEESPKHWRKVNDGAIASSVLICRCGFISDDSRGGWE